MTNFKPSKENVRKLIANRGENTSDCLKVLGDYQPLYSIADFWERMAGSIHLIATNELLEFVDNEVYNTEQVECFKKGLAAIPLFFQSCLEERQFLEKQKMKPAAPPPSMAGVQ